MFLYSASAFKTYQKDLIFFIAFFLLCLSKQAFKNGKFSDLFISKRKFGSYFQQGKGCTATSRKQKPEKCMNLPIYHKHFKFSGRTAPFLLYKNSLKNAKFLVFLPPKHTLVITLSKPHSLTSRRYAAEQDIDIPDHSETIKLFWFHSFVFDIE